MKLYCIKSRWFEEDFPDHKPFITEGNVYEGEYITKTKISFTNDLGVLHYWDIDNSENLKYLVTFNEVCKTAYECKPAKGTEAQWSDKHYDFTYKLTSEDIEKGFIKIDPYLVNRIWRINSWDDTGAAFHSLKNYARISNGKNPLERDLTSLYKQVKVLCKLHGVNLDD